MYEIGTPIVGGIAGTVVLAQTGASSFGIAITGLVLLLAGLAVLRTRLVRRRAIAHDDVA